MTEKSWLTDDILKAILERVESCPEATFHKSELSGISTTSFSRLLEHDFLQKIRTPDNPTFVDSDGERYRVKRNGDKLIGWPLSSDSNGTITLTAEQITRFRFKISTLVEMIREKNKLSGKALKNEGRVIYVGESNAGIRVCLGLFEDDNQAKSGLFQIRSQIGRQPQILVLCPTYEPDQTLLSELEDRSVQCVNFKRGFKTPDFEIDFSFVPITSAKDMPAPLTESEETAIKKYGYKSWDELEFLGEKATYGSYFIKISGKKEKVPSALMLLLLHLALKLKKDKQGWVSRDEAADLKIIDPYKENHYDDLVHKLRNKIGPYLRTCERDEFIETSERRFRISIPPGRIMQPSNQWIEDTFSKVKEELLKKRRKKGEQWMEGV